MDAVPFVKADQALATTRYSAARQVFGPRCITLLRANDVHDVAHQEST